MNEDFVPFELAEKLMLKGFNDPCIAYYDEGCLLYNTKYPFALTAEELFISHNSEYTWVDAPTISQVLKWLREEKKIHIVIDICNGNWEYNIKEKIRLNEFLQYVSQTIPVPICCGSSYKAAAIAGIEYVLDNLI